MQTYLLEKYVKPTVTELIGKLNAEWSDDVAMRLHEALGDYLDLATCEHLSRKDEPTPKPKQTPVVAIGNGEPNPYELKGTCLKKAPEGMPAYIKLEDDNTQTYTLRKSNSARGKDRVPYGMRTNQYEKLFAFMTTPENLGKAVTISPEDVDMTLDDLRVVTAKFNDSKWRKAHHPDSKLRTKNNLMNVTCQLVRADMDLRGKRFGCS